MSLQKTQEAYTRFREALLANENALVRQLTPYLLLMFTPLLPRWSTTYRALCTLFAIVKKEADEGRAVREIWHFLNDQYRGVGNLIQPLERNLDGRAEWIALQLVNLRISSGRLLDFGCGDGGVMRVLSEYLSGGEGLTISSYDVRAPTSPHGRFTTDWVQVERWAQEKPSGRFDTTLALYCLHHCNDVDREIARLQAISDCIFLFESTIDPVGMPWEVQFFVDWLYNRGFHPGVEIPVPGNFATAQSWIERFTASGEFQLRTHEVSGIDLPIVPEWHELFVFIRT